MTIEEIEKNLAMIESMHDNDPVSPRCVDDLRVRDLLAVAEAVKRLGPGAWRTIIGDESFAEMFGDVAIDELEK